jgi:hypothetical protein
MCIHDKSSGLVSHFQNGADFSDLTAGGRAAWPKAARGRRVSAAVAHCNKRFLLALALCKLNGKVPQVVGFLQLNPGPPSAKTLGAIPKYVSTFGLHNSQQIAKKIWPIEIMLWELSVLMKKAHIWSPISKMVQFPKIWPLLAELWSQHFFSCPDGSHRGYSWYPLWLPRGVQVLFPCS